MLEDFRGRRYDALSISDSRSLFSKDLNPGIQTEGYLIFDIPENLDDYTWFLAFEETLSEPPAFIDLGLPKHWNDRR